MTVARPRIRSAIREGIQDSFLYHRNSKVAKILQRSDTNTYQVHLMTLTAKDDMEVEETSKEDTCEEMDTESSSNNE